MRVELTELQQTAQANQPIIALIRHNHWFLLGLDSHSRYFGYWLNLHGTVRRLIDSFKLNETIERVLITGPASARLIFHTGQIELSLDDQGLNLIASRPIELTIIFDIRALTASTDWGNNYTFLPSDHSYVLQFNQDQENWSLEAQINYEGELKLVNQWIEQNYTFDLGRQSPPFKRFVLAGLKGRITALKVFCSDKPIITPITAILTNPLQNFLLQRCLSLFNSQHFMAGLPWFPQVWFRDELISLWNLEGSFNHNAILTDYYNQLEDWWSINRPSGQTAADTLLWLLFVSPLELTQQRLHQLEPIFQAWLETYAKAELKLSHGQTWMDTLARERAIEIDSLLLATLKKLKPLIHNQQLNDLATYFHRRIKTALILDAYPAEELARPNIFLAYLIYPSLVNSKIWRQLFDQLIQRNFTSWGGFSSLSHDTPHYQPQHTGEKPQSYHQGDSWFWLNNLAALALHQFDHQTYADVIDKIVQASLKDLFNYGLGWSSELSDSQNFQPAGSPIQLWSMATLLQLLKHIQTKASSA